MKSLTQTQRKILQFLQQRAQEGLPPTVREICAAASIKSTSTVHNHLKKLEDEGYIERQSGLNRAIRVRGTAGGDLSRMPRKVPLIGRVTAGLPILAVENIEDYVPYSGHHDTKNLFALRVQGTSMMNAGIMDGDVVVVLRTSSAENGDIIVALLEDEATVKRFFREGDGRFRLQPENDAFEPIITDKLSVLGRVVSLIRYF